MLDLELTKKMLGDVGLLGYRPYVIYVCDVCGKQCKVRYDPQKKAHHCRKCVANDPEKRMRSSAGARKGWQDPEYRKKIEANTQKLWRNEEYRKKMDKVRNDPEFIRKLVERNKSFKIDPDKISTNMKRIWEDSGYRKHISKHLTENSRKNWKDPEYRKRHKEALTKAMNSPEVKGKLSDASIKMWKDPEYVGKIKDIFGSKEFKEKMSVIRKEMWANLRKDPAFKEKLGRRMALVRANLPKVSSLQDLLYSMLDDLGVKYYREYNDKPDDPQCIIGPWSFDCVIPRKGQTTLLIEVQGEYWHSLKGNVSRDQSKANYILNNFQGIYELKCIWEHEFLCKDKVIEDLKYWLGISKIDIIDFNFNDVVIRECPRKDYSLLLNKYHYLHNAGRGGITYGAYLNDELTAVCVFSPLIRQNIGGSIGEDQNNAKELSRFCVHPRYQKPNFGSWMISRCINTLSPKYKVIISYCDTTFNYLGAMYKACNFIQDKEVRPDYWYVKQNGWVMHKKTLYNHAVQLKMKEAEYAESLGYKKVFGKKKLRFIFKR